MFVDVVNVMVIGTETLYLDCQVLKSMISSGFRQDRNEKIDVDFWSMSVRQQDVWSN